MKRAFRRPSPAMIVAIVALIAALGGTALAGGVLNKKKVKNISNNQITQRAPGLSVASANSAKSADTAKSADSANNATTANKAKNVLAASVNSAGALLHATDAGTTSSGGAGVYHVVFPRDITTCSSVATGKAGGREINSFQSGNNNDIAVLTFDSAGGASANAFDIVVVC